MKPQGGPTIRPCPARSRTHRAGGFTLTEALVTVLILGTFIVVLFLTIVWGFRTFSTAVSRADVTTEARRLALFIEQELRTSSFFSVHLDDRTVDSEERDAICFASRKDWSSPNSFDLLESKPAYDRYFLYYPTEELPYGRLIRLELSPPDPQVGAFPYRPFLARPSDYRLPGASSGYPAEVTSSRTLASSVKSMSIRKLFGTQEIEMRLLLRQHGAMSRMHDGSRRGGTFELHYVVYPENTY